jgi:hypothetical protein
MKQVLALVLLSIISLSSCNAAMNKTNLIDFTKAFCDQLGLDTFDDFVVKLNNDTKVIKKLFLEIERDWVSHNSTTWVDTADFLSKLGRLMKVVARAISSYAGDQKLVEQINGVLNNLNFVMKHPNVFTVAVTSNLKNNSMTLLWEVNDMRKLLMDGNFKELGTRSANLWLTVTKGGFTPVPEPTPTPKSANLRLLLGKKAGN